MALIEDRFEDTLLIARPGDAAVLTEREPGPPRLPVVRTRGHHPADVRPTLAAIHEQLGLDAVVLACRRVSVTAGGVVQRRLALEAVSASTERTDLGWLPADALAEAADELAEAADAVAEAAVPSDEQAWTRPGWFARATQWITHTLHAADLHIEQIRAWEFSCVLRVQTDLTDYYFKALPAVYAAEPRLVQQLASWQPGRVPDVVAVEPDEHWLLTRNCPGQSLELGASLAAWERAAAAYAELQIAASQHLPGLRALGCRQRDPLALQALIAPLLADTPALQLDAEHGLDAVELRRLRELGPCLEAACLELGAIGELPLSLEHGDLWGSNVYVSDDQVAFIDWTEASLAHPFFSLTPLLQSARWDPSLAGVPDAEQRIVERYLEAWSAYARPDTLRQALALARPLAALHIATTYWRDVPQPHRQWWMPRAVPFFLRLALAEWSATHA